MDTKQTALGEIPVYPEQTYYFAFNNDAFIRLNFQFVQENDRTWVARCRQLGTVAPGDTPEEAEDALKGATMAFLMGIQHDGDIVPFLQERGVQFYFRSDDPIKSTVKVLPEEATFSKAAESV